MSRSHAWSIGALLLLAVVIRGWGLGAKPLWLDESMSVARASNDLWEPFWLSARRDNHPFLYYLLLHFVAGPGAGDAAVRAISLVASLFAAAGTCLLAREAVNERAGLWALALSGASAYQLYFAQEARPYALATAFAAFACWNWVRMWRRGFTAGRLAAYGACSVLAVYSFYYAGLLLVAQVVHAAIEGRRWREFAGRLWITWTLCAVAIAPLTVHLRFLREFTGLGTRAPGAIDSAALLQAAREHLFGYMQVVSEDSALLAGLAVVALGTSVCAGIWLALRAPEAARPLLPLVAVPLLALFLYRAPVKFEAKHLAMCAPAIWAILAAAGRERGRGDLLLGVVLLVNLAGDAQYLSDGFVKEDWRGVAETVEEGYRPGDAIVLCPFYLKNPFERCFRPRPYDMVRVTYAGGESEIDRGAWWILDSRRESLGVFVLDAKGARSDLPIWTDRTKRYWVVEGRSNTIPYNALLSATFYGAGYEPKQTEFHGMEDHFLWVTLWEPGPR